MSTSAMQGGHNITMGKAVSDLRFQTVCSSVL